MITTAPPAEHPFAQYVRILGRGRRGRRSLTQDEAREAFGMVLRGQAEDLQVGAFLMLLRVKEESAPELAGFVQACRAQFDPAPPAIAADLDWPSYAGKKHQHPWYVLSQLLLAGAGYRVFVHGCAGHTPGRLYTQQAFRGLGLPVAQGWDEVAACLDHGNLAYLPLDCCCAPLADLVALKPLLGLRSPVNTLTRMLNPLQAPASLQSIFHPAYAQLHLAGDSLLGQPRSMVFKGESGEVEVKPHAATRLVLQLRGDTREAELARTLHGRVSDVSEPAVAPLRAVWRGEAEDPYGLAATLATTTAALLLLEPGLSPETARGRARTLWHERDFSRLD